MQSNVESLIADIKSDHNKLADAGLIDETALFRDVRLGLKKFGNDVCHLQERVVQVEGGYAQLPDSFFALDFAYLCEPVGYTTNIERHELQSSYFYTEKTRFNSTWNECTSNCCEEQSETVIRENLYFKKGSAQFYYKNPTLLKLGKSFEKSNCLANCRNKMVTDSPNEITIIGFRLQANFNEGHIYIRYKGLPVDENGNIEIPSTANGHVETYMEYYLKRRMAERLLGNAEAQYLQALFPVYKQEERVALKNASNELKMKSITPQSMQAITRLNKLESLQYENNIQWPVRRV